AEVDPERLQQVILNLLSNAIKFTPPGGLIDVHLDVRDADLELTVRDNGEGIAPEALPHIFDRFHQGIPRGGATSGLGLGLTISRHIVQAHRGTITGHSEGKGRGALFTVRLPRTAVLVAEPHAPVSNVPAPSECPPHVAGRRVLIVE